MRKKNLFILMLLMISACTNKVTEKTEEQNSANNVLTNTSWTFLSTDVHPKHCIIEFKDDNTYIMKAMESDAQIMGTYRVSNDTLFMKHNLQDEYPPSVFILTENKLIVNMNGEFMEMQKVIK